MLQKKLRKSITFRVFFLTFLILLSSCSIIFGLVAWATPRSYTDIVNSELQKQMYDLSERLSGTSFDDSGSVIDDFIRSTGTNVTLLDGNGNSITTDKSMQADENNDTDIDSNLALATTIDVDVTFSDRKDTYMLSATSILQTQNHVVLAIRKMLPWMLLVMILFSLFCAWIYSRSITSPIVRLSKIAVKMAEMDFEWDCETDRQDEIGQLGGSLKLMSQKLSCALSALKTSNEALRREMEQEQELEMQRMHFFSAASHELKTPVTILKGQLAGMLDGVDIYQDKEKYLARSLQVTARMENLIQQILTVSQMERHDINSLPESVHLSTLIAHQLELYKELIEQRNLKIIMDLHSDLMIKGNPFMLEKVIGNLLSNAFFYSPEEAEIRVWSGFLEECPALTIENTAAHISEEALPHLFEPFYREDSSRNRRTGGSGLGLYLVHIILERHGAECSIDNSTDGVVATIRFNQSNK